ncbi:MAG TPA: N-acetyl sugar amidotransferase [Coxiellaceae bacterium]|nr:N-acetyl sugar amidotransferase [Coxiellaceae bacterium]
MSMVSYPENINVQDYQKENGLVALYGLPPHVQFCKRCTYSNQKPNSEREFKHTIQTKKPTVNFNNEGVCSACSVAERKKSTDWVARKKLLRELCDRYRRTDGHYDCLVPGSGGKDSFYAAHKLKYEYGMNPLTVTWAPHIYTEWGWKNFQAWIHAGFDNYLFTPNGRVHRLLTRLALEKLFHPFQPFIVGQMYFPPKLAAQLNIPLVFYGENPMEYGNAIEEGEKPTKDFRYFTSSNIFETYLAGVHVQELQRDFGLTLIDLEPYLPTHPETLNAKKIEVHYLGYYLPWHPQGCYYYAMEKGGFKPAPERTAGTYSKYSSIDDKMDDLHYYTTFIKFGIGRATYDSSQEIRCGEITREEGIALVKRFDGEYSDRFESENFSYLSIPEKEFPIAYKKLEHPPFDRKYLEALTNRFRSPHLWRWTENRWTLRHAVYKTV